MTVSLDENYLKKCIEKNNIKGELVHVGEEVKTVDEASEKLGVKLKYVIKSILLIVDGKPHIAIISGENKLDLNKVKKILNAKNIRFATKEEVLKYTGYQPGAIPPICHKQEIPIIIDKKILRYEYVYGGGGSFYHLLKIRTWNLQKISKAKVKDISK